MRSIPRAAYCKREAYSLSLHLGVSRVFDTKSYNELIYWLNCLAIAHGEQHML